MALVPSENRRFRRDHPENRKTPFEFEQILIEVSLSLYFAYTLKEK